MTCDHTRHLMVDIVLLQNFVGLSVSEGYIATGSETNEVSHIITVALTVLTPRALI